MQIDFGIMSSPKDPRIRTGSSSLEFSATGKGANGLQEYEFRLDLFKPVDEEVRPWAQNLPHK